MTEFTECLHWCDRIYGFEYDKVYAHKELAMFPMIAPLGKIEWKKNRIERNVG